MKTMASIKFGLVDVTAKSDSILNIENKKSFSNINNLKCDNLEEIKYATLEKNQFALDGTFNIISDFDNISWWSNTMSDENCEFDDSLTMEINFTKPHSSYGLTFVFSESNDYCNHLNIKFYDINNELINNKDFNPNNKKYFCKMPTENYKRILITFYSTNNPYRYLKLYKILYGVEMDFEGDNLLEANILEEVNLLSSELSINTLDFSAYSQDDDFNILNPQGAYALLQERQKLEVKEILKNKTKNMGTFYLNTWSNEKDKTMKFEAIDLLGIIDKTYFDGGMYNNETFINLLEEIFTSASLESDEYQIQENLKQITLTGYIPICTHREALQQVIFAVGAVADCSRSDKIKIYKVEEKTTNLNIIKKSSIFQGTKKIKQNELVTGVSIVAHNYKEGTEQKEVFKGTLQKGYNKVLFNNPTHGLTITNGTIITSNCNYAIINCNEEKDVIINGYEYLDNLQTYLIEINNLNSNQKRNILKVESAYLINNRNVKNIGESILNFYKKAYTTSLEILLEDETLTETIEIQEDFEQKFIGQITKLDIDLTGGFISNIELNCEVKEVNNE